MIKKMTNPYILFQFHHYSSDPHPRPPAPPPLGTGKFLESLGAGAKRALT